MNEVTAVSSGGVLQGIQGTVRARMRRKGAVLSLEAMIYIAILLIFAAIGLGIFSMRNSAKLSTARTEMDQIRSAAIEYNNFIASGAWPTDVNTLFNQMSADQAMDGVVHGPFLQKTGRWASGQANDPFGGTYVLQNDADGLVIKMQGGDYPDGAADVSLKVR